MLFISDQLLTGLRKEGSRLVSVNTLDSNRLLPVISITRPIDLRIQVITYVMVVQPDKVGRFKEGSTSSSSYGRDSTSQMHFTSLDTRIVKCGLKIVHTIYHMCLICLLYP